MNKFTIALFIIISLFFSGGNLALAQIGEQAGDQAEAGLVEKQVYPVRVYFFHSESCPHCREENKFLDKLQKERPYLEIHRYRLEDRGLNEELFLQVVSKENLSGGVPVTIIGSWVRVGFDHEDGIGQEILTQIDNCRENVCSNWIDRFLGLPELTPQVEEISVSSEGKDSSGEDVAVIDKRKVEDSATSKKEEMAKVKGENSESDSATNGVMIFGKNIDLNGEKSFYFWGVVLGLADGINPCMFSVLLFLLTYLLAIGSRKRAIKAGAVFVVTTFAVYFLMMIGVIKIIDILGIYGLVRKLVILLSGIVGVIMVKDFFFYGKGVSLEIGSKFKPVIEKLIKKGTVWSAFLLAIFSSIVELPCTSGIPLAYMAMLKENGDKFWAVAWYNLFFVMPLIVIISAVSFTWVKVSKIEDGRVRYRHWMRLIAGILLLFLALSLYLNWI